MVEYHKVFKGEVKVSDVQEAFDDIVARINNMVDYYNNMSLVIDIDYSVGAKTLAPAGYTLSIGGLKQLLRTYNGCVIGGKPIRISSNKLILTDGLVISNGRVYRLPTREITTNLKIGTVYYNVKTDTYSVSSNPNESSYNLRKICDINMKSDSDYVATLRNVLNQDFDGHYKITTQSVQFGNVAQGDPIYPDTSKEPKFVSAMDSVRYQWDGTSTVYLFNTEVSSNNQTGSRNLNFWVPMNFLFLPKGISNPYRVENGDSTKTLNAIIDKK